MRRRTGYVALLIVATLAVLAQAADGAIDPFTLVPASPTMEEFIANPYPGYGDIVGIDAFEAGQQLGVLHSGGNVVFYNSDMSQELETLGLTGGTGLAEIPASYGQGGTIAIFGFGGTEFFTKDGVQTGSEGYTIPTIEDGDWDSAYGRLLLLTGSGLYTPAEGTDVDLVAGVAGTSLESIDMDAQYFDMFARDAVFNQFNADGTHNTGINKVTSYGEEQLMEGMTFTIDKGFVALSNGIIRYSKAEFQDHMSYEVPEPSTLVVLALAAALLVSRRGTGR